MFKLGYIRKKLEFNKKTFEIIAFNKKRKVTNLMHFKI